MENVQFGKKWSLTKQQVSQKLQDYTISVTSQKNGKCSRNKHTNGKKNRVKRL